MDNNYNYLNDMNSDYLKDMENKDETLTKREVIYLMARSFSNNAFSSEKAYLELIDNVKNAQTKHDPNHEQIYEDSLEKAKELINDFCVDEYGEGADFTDLHDVGIAYTTYTDDEKEFQVTADLIDCKITYEYDGETVKTEQYKDIDDMVKNGLTGLDFDELVSLPDNISDKVYIQEAADRFKKDTDSLINTVHDFYDKVYEGEKSISKKDVAAALTDPAKASELATQLQADIERRKQQREQDQKTISALREENAQLRRNNEKSASINENLRKENRDLKRKACPERYVLPSFINVEATRIYKDKQGQCHIAMKFTGGSKEYSEKMSNEDFMAFMNGDLTKEEVIAQYHKSLIEGYIRREFSKPEKRSVALSLIENTIFGYMKLYASSTFVPSSGGDNNPRKRRNYDDIDDMNDEERKGLSYR